jgi:hypothetical protein
MLIAMHWQERAPAWAAQMRKSLTLLLVAAAILIGPTAAPTGDSSRWLGASAVGGEYDAWLPLHLPANARPGLRGWWLDHNSQYLYPPYEGFATGPRIVTLARGMQVDRYGQPTGRFLAPAGTSYEARSVPYDKAKMEYHRYVVIRPFSVQTGRIASWFDQRGGGIQYRTEKPVQALIDEGHLRKIR